MAVFISPFRCSITIVALLVGGCVSRAPDLPAYRPGAVVPDHARNSWSRAKAGHPVGEREPGHQASSFDPTLDRWMARATTLRQEAEEKRQADASSIMNRMRATAGGPRAGDLARLADLRRAGLSPALDLQAGQIIDQGIEIWSDAALAAIDRDDDAATIEALSTISMAAADGRHPRLELETRHQAARLMDRTERTWDEPLPSRVLAYTLERLVEVHVDRPDWRALVAAGFEAVLKACIDEVDRQEVQRMRTIFDQRTGTLDSIPGNVPRIVTSALRQVGVELLAASKPPRSIFGVDTDGVRIFLEGMIAQTDIRTRAYYGKDAESLERLFDDSYIGIGAEVQFVPEGVMLSPLAGGPARRAGIRKGDLLIEVDGVPIGHQPIGRTIDRILGRIGTVVDLAIERQEPDGTMQSLVIPVIRGEVERETLNGWRQVGHDAMGRPLWDWIVDPDAGIAYVGIREFVEDTDRRFRTAMAEANRELQAVGGSERQIEGLIIDLRENSGGRRDSTERLLDLFLSKGELFATEGAQVGQDDRTMASRGNTRLEGMPVVVIVDESSASASEILAGTLQGRADAIVLGERTLGKGSVQQVASMPDGYLVVTESWFLVPDETNGTRTIDRFRDPDHWGILPDVSSPATEEETTRFLEERGGWRSGLGQDGFDLDALPTVDSTNDRPLLDAVIILRGRLSHREFGTRPAQ